MNEIILISIIIIILISVVIMLRVFFLVKSGFESIILQMMKDHETFITIQKSLLKEYKNRLDDTIKIQKDINNIRIGFKNAIDELLRLIKSISKKDKL